MKLTLLTFTISQLGMIGLSLAQIIPSEISSILIQLPVVGLFAWYVLYSNKQNREWLDRSAEAQEKRHTRKEEAQEKRHERTIELFEKILDRMDIRQGELTNHLKENNNQLGLNTATVNESMRQGELAEEIKKLIGDRK